MNRAFLFMILEINNKKKLKNKKKNLKTKKEKVKKSFNKYIYK